MCHEHFKSLIIHTFPIVAIVKHNSKTNAEQKLTNFLSRK